MGAARAASSEPGPGAGAGAGQPRASQSPARHTHGHTAPPWHVRPRGGGGGGGGGGRAHPEGGVEADVVGAAHLVVLLLGAVQRGDPDGGGPIWNGEQPVSPAAPASRMVTPSAASAQKRSHAVRLLGRHVPRLSVGRGGAGSVWPLVSWVRDTAEGEPGGGGVTPGRPQGPSHAANTCEKGQPELRRLPCLKGTLAGSQPSLAHRVLGHGRWRRASPPATSTCPGHPFSSQVTTASTRGQADTRRQQQDPVGGPTSQASTSSSV